MTQPGTGNPVRNEHKKDHSWWNYNKVTDRVTTHSKFCKFNENNHCLQNEQKTENNCNHQQKQT